MGFELNDVKTKVQGQHCRQSVEEHIKRSKMKEWVCAGEPETIRYLQHLLGQVHYILQITPGAVEFQQERIDIKRMMEQKNI